MGKQKIALFTSHMPGIEVLRCLGRQPFQNFEISLVITDDPDSQLSNSKRRIWRYGLKSELKSEIELLANSLGIPIESTDVNQDSFVNRLVKLEIDGVLMCVFGQILRRQLLQEYQGRCWNIHPTYATRPWPSCQGVNPFEQLLENEVDSFRLVLHEVTSDIDGGKELLASNSIAICPTDDVMSLNAKSACHCALVSRAFLTQLGRPEFRGA